MQGDWHDTDTRTEERENDGRCHRTSSAREVGTGRRALPELVFREAHRFGEALHGERGVLKIRFQQLSAKQRWTAAGALPRRRSDAPHEISPKAAMRSPGRARRLDPIPNPSACLCPARPLCTPFTPPSFVDHLVLPLARSRWFHVNSLLLRPRRSIGLLWMRFAS